MFGPDEFQQLHLKYEHMNFYVEDERASVIRSKKCHREQFEKYVIRIYLCISVYLPYM